MKYDMTYKYEWEKEQWSDKKKTTLQIFCNLPFIAVKILGVDSNNDPFLWKGEWDGSGVLVNIQVKPKHKYVVSFYSIVTGNVLREDAEYIETYGMLINALPQYFPQDIFKREYRKYKISIIK